MRSRSLLPFFLPIGVLLPFASFAGCTADSAQNPLLDYDASDTFDAASPTFDAAIGIDSSPPADAHTSPDSTLPQDSSAPDTAVPIDSAMPLDSTAPTDSAIAVDANLGADAPAEAQASDASDAEVIDAADAASPPDAGDASDAGSGVALAFDSTNSEQVIMNAPDGGANETAYTAEVWFNTTTATGNFFEVYGGGGADRFVFIQNGQVCFYVFDGIDTTVCSTAATYNDGTWHHAAGTLGALNGTCIYVDGVVAKCSATPTESSFNYDTNFRMGYGHTALNSLLIYYTGELDEVRVWSVERTAAEIQANYQTHIAGTTPGLQGYWKLDGSGTQVTAPDSTPNGNDGTLTNFMFTTSPWVTPGAF